MYAAPKAKGATMKQKLVVKRVLIPRKTTARDRYGVHERTLSRWEDDGIFPRGIRINGHIFDDVTVLDQWDAKNRKGAA
jgi:hypothetical protein